MAAAKRGGAATLAAPAAGGSPLALITIEAAAAAAKPQADPNNEDSSSISLFSDTEIPPGAHNEALLLAGFGMYRSELQQLLRLHFNKLLQQNKPAAAAAMPLVEVKAYAYDPLPLTQEAQATAAAVAAATALAGGGFEVSVDAAETASVRAYWGVTRKAMEAFSTRMGKALLQRLPLYSGLVRTAAFSQLPISCLLVEATAFDSSRKIPAAAFAAPAAFALQDNTCGQVMPCSEGLFPLVITASVVVAQQEDKDEFSVSRQPSKGEASCHLLLLRCRPLPPPPPSTSSKTRLSAAAAVATATAPFPSCYVSHRFEVYRQLLAGGSLTKPQEKGDVFGVSSNSGTYDIDCLVCMTNPKTVVLYPCRHCALCVECLQALHQEKCPVCRSPFFAFITFPLKKQLAAAHAAGHVTPAAPVGAAADASAAGALRSTASSSAAPAPHQQRGGSRVVPLS
ncbi:hypothetical protein cyc_00081 [Cyclospora cayetanensis]|uniref:RING-type domain-containing protein n=1 Tax=Cyclospora cayetanensis TaxID=88456 RepID=A0A1D3D1G5_9EIME|nr:hypothetical protein cyc_00081 [Cyclospora cayetanensis]